MDNNIKEIKPNTKKRIESEKITSNELLSISLADKSFYLKKQLPNRIEKIKNIEISKIHLVPDINFFQSKYLTMPDFIKSFLVNRTVATLEFPESGSQIGELIQSSFKSGKGKIGIFKISNSKNEVLVLVEQSLNFISKYLKAPFALLQFYECELFCKDFSFENDKLLINPSIYVDDHTQKVQGLTNDLIWEDIILSKRRDNLGITKIEKENSETQFKFIKIKKEFIALKMVIEKHKKTEDLFQKHLADVQKHIEKERNLEEQLIQMRKKVKNTEDNAEYLPVDIDGMIITPMKVGEMNDEGIQTDKIGDSLACNPCINCKKEAKRVVNLPCCHMMYCEGCWETLKIGEKKRACGFCHQEIKKTIIGIDVDEFI